MEQKLVTIICLCHNQGDFVRESLDSIIEQTYSAIEMIIVDDASSDESKLIIRDFLKDKPLVQYFDLIENIGNCKAFNKGLAMAKGAYIVDLSCDDVLQTDRISKQVSYLESLPSDYGVVYSNAIYIDIYGENQGIHFTDQSNFPSGDIFLPLIDRYIISAPTMLIKRVVMEELKGYDGNLAYEDFDFWVRSARNWKYGYQDQALTKIISVPGSL